MLSAMCWAISSPAAAGTQTAEPGTLLRPGGGASGCEGSVGGSSLNTTVSRSTPRRRSSRRMTRASGQTSVSYTSAMRKRERSSLFPVPRAEMMGMPPARAASMRSSLQATRSMQSAI